MPSLQLVIHKVPLKISGKTYEAYLTPTAHEQNATEIQ